ncbi:DinB family protein [Hyphomonas sp. FCG-A18]|uniref:DinB family protein n=1 Tax=Hyphomonas sp. FCG-A18 TaxID=3080019 RepID=UPI002B30108A|nr:DinB family protein [Hyphomonas sp. FCG-A18]
MIKPGYLQHMARYNRWQNDNLYTAADTLSEAERRQDRGSFFKSIHATFSHILWADQTWMSRLGDWEAPKTDIPGSTTLYNDWAELRSLRIAADFRFIRWADELSQSDADGDLIYFSTSGEQQTRKRAICLMQVFNHQTHHRGQIHAMLTAAGAKPDDTDIQFMPEAYF